MRVVFAPEVEEDLYGLIKILVSSQKMAIDCNLYLRCEQKF